MAPPRRWLAPVGALALSVGASACQLVGGIGDISLVDASTPDTSDARDSESHPRSDAPSRQPDAHADAHSTKNPPDAHKDVATVRESGAARDVGVDTAAGDAGCSSGCEGSMCASNVDCASGNCSNNQCAPPSCTPTCDTGAARESNVDCGSDSCGADHQCLAPGCSPLCSVGSACADDGNCASESCENNVCACGEKGTPCTTSADCCSPATCIGVGSPQCE